MALALLVAALAGIPAAAPAAAPSDVRLYRRKSLLASRDNRIHDGRTEPEFECRGKR